MDIVEDTSATLSTLSTQVQITRDTIRRLNTIHQSLSGAQLTDERRRNLQAAYAELQGDHAEAVQRYDTLRRSNEALKHLVTEVAPLDKQQLLDELEEARQGTRMQEEALDHARGEGDSWDQRRRAKEALLRAQEQEISEYIDQCEEYAKRGMVMVQYSNQLIRDIDDLEAKRIPLETKNSTLARCTALQGHTKEYLQQEIQLKEDQCQLRAQEVLQLKKHMASSLLELQLKIQRTEDELQAAQEGLKEEREMLERQYYWLAGELQDKTKQLLADRSARTEESSQAKNEIMMLKETLSRLENNTSVVAQQNAVLEADLHHMDQLAATQRDEYAARRDATASEMQQHTEEVTTASRELQNAQSLLQWWRTHLCSQCRPLVE